MTTTGDVTPTMFADWLLEGLGDDPATHPNAQAVIVDWEAEEGGNWHNSASANPLNTTLPYDGSTVLSGGGAAAKAGVQAYKSWPDGLAATLDTLTQTNIGGTDPYTPITSALAADDAQGAAAAIVASPWGTKTIPLGSTYNPPATTNTTGTSSGTTAESAGLLTNPVGTVWNDVEPFLVKAMFALGALALVALGAKQLVQPAVDKGEAVAGDVGKAAAL
jgi:hypothetical protein